MIELKVNEIRINSPYQGFFNAYNILAAVSLAKLLSIEEQIIQQAVAAYEPQAGRMESFRIMGKRVVLILVKNPAGLNQSLAALSYDKARKNVFIALNDNAADGRDISWIWDADAEMIVEKEMNIASLVCSGQRSGDIALRLKYAGLPLDKINIQTGLKEGIEMAIRKESEASYILSTYTALFACRKILAKMQQQHTGSEEVRSLEGV
ncbi:MAG: MurT ligase domain-containing protein [Syntrophomonadaceae bacterium]|nr:MurT ligase domain-containing protein [Syntrophomonadaceae bacterium]